MARSAFTTSDALDEVLRNVKHEQQRNAAELRDKARFLRDSMAKVMRMVDAGDYDDLNGLGEVQALGTGVDMLCARLAQLATVRRDLVETRGRVNVTE